MPDNLPSSGGQDPISALLGQALSISNQDIQQALAPTMQRGPIQMPSYFTTPRKEVLPAAQLDHRETVGAGNARAQGIGNSISAGVRTLSNFIAKRDNQKQMAEATKVQRFLSSQYEMDQADLILKSDPKNQQALQAKQQAQTIMAGMFQGPDGAKFTKTLEKGFDISLTDPSLNKTEHHSIVQKGIDLFKKQHQQAPPPNAQQAQQMVQKFSASQPKQLGPDPRAMQLFQYRMAQQQQWGQLVKAVLPQIMRNQAADSRAQYTQGMQNLRQAQTQLFETVKQEQQFKNDATLAKMRHKYHLDEIATSSNLAFNRITQIFSSEKNDPTVLYKLKTDETKNFAQHEAQLNNALVSGQANVMAAQAEFTKPGADKAAAAKNLQDAKDFVASVQMQQKNYQAYKTSFYNGLANIERIQGIGGSPSASTTENSSDSGSGGGPNTFDPNALLNAIPFLFSGSNPLSGAVP